MCRWPLTDPQHRSPGPMSRFLLASFLILPLNASAMGLLEVLELAEQHDAIYQAALADHRAVLAEQDIGESDMLPQLSFSAFARETRSTTTDSTSASSPNGDSDFGSRGYSLTLSQTLYDKQVFDSIDADQARSARAQLELQAARQALVLRVAESYFALASARDSVRLAKAETSAIGQQLEQAKERFDAGLIPITDVRESQAQYDLAIANGFIAESELDNSREAIRTLIDTDVAQTVDISDDMPLLAPDPDDIESWQRQAMRGNLELLASGLALEAARLEVESARGELYPVLSVDAEHSFSSSDGSTVSNAFSGRDLEQNSVTLNLTIPIYEGGGNRASVRQRVAEHDAARARHEQQQRLTMQSVRSAWLNVKASISRVKALQQALASTRLATEATRLSFEVGKRNSVDVLIAQREQYSSENEYRRARYDYLLNTLRLEQAVGRLDSELIRQISAHMSGNG